MIASESSGSGVRGRCDSTGGCCRVDACFTCPAAEKFGGIGDDGLGVRREMDLHFRYTSSAWVCECITHAPDDVEDILSSIGKQLL